MFILNLSLAHLDAPFFVKALPGWGTRWRYQATYSGEHEEWFWSYLLVSAASMLFGHEHP